VWVPDDFIELFHYLDRHRGMTWALYDGAVGGDEFLFLFHKSARADAVDHYPATLARLYAEATQRRIDRTTREIGDLRAELCRRSWLARGIHRVTGRFRATG
jgi:hypothetical protein